MMLLYWGPDSVWSYIDSSQSITTRSIRLIQAIALLSSNNVFYMHATNGEWNDKPALVEL